MCANSRRKSDDTGDFGVSLKGKSATYCKGSTATTSLLRNVVPLRNAHTKLGLLSAARGCSFTITVIGINSEPIGAINN